MEERERVALFDSDGKRRTALVFSNGEDESEEQTPGACQFGHPKSPLLPHGGMKGAHESVIGSSAVDVSAPYQRL